MGITKSELFTDQENEIALLGKAFSHPARVAIILHLLKTKSCINSHLVQELGLAQATISQHLRELKEIGIIQGTIEGISVNYCINAQKWDEIRQLFNKVFDKMDSSDQAQCC